MDNARKQKFIQGGIIIISSLIWAGVILACSWILENEYEKISHVLILGATIHILMLSSVFIDRLRKETD
ncbi:hypothetical protein [Persicitalea jodogahamensis]|uniref:Uncharacterized protein n=1 Tax=Persicitalea jodogahamensis TaxID=402147 RepID=A0A8J3D790_9BACT|nr:hypothetical protein [Persicitalea jodogahamensis]GHB61599.1 hypothetical protein GCM10007390_14360 [Persicitalea jodogahamensis]